MNMKRTLIERIVFQCRFGAITDTLLPEEKAERCHHDDDTDNDPPRSVAVTFFDKPQVEEREHNENDGEDNPQERHAMGQKLDKIETQNIVADNSFFEHRLLNADR